QVTLDLGEARLLRGLLYSVALDAARTAELMRALAAKDASTLSERSAGLPEAVRRGLNALLRLYGGLDVLAAARTELPDRPLIRAGLTELQSLANRLQDAHPEARVGFDLADLGGYAYYSGARFAVYTSGSSDAIARGGRYDEIGAVFGRN